MPVLKVKKNGIWEEVSGGSSVEVDATLTQTGQAADAKAVGDALAGKQPVGDYATIDYVDSAISAIPTPDISGQISAHNTAADAHTDIRNAIPTKVSELSNDSGFISGYTETDPTVPAWAKAANKPSYTASEVGADASGSANAALDSAKSYIDSEIAEWVGDTKVSEQISAAINPLSSEIANKSAVGHKHTKSEITDFPTSMTPTAHKHTKSEITDFPSSMTPTAHNQAASTITAGTFAGQVVANSGRQTPGTSLLRNSKLVSADTNPTVNGEICWTYK